MVTLRVIKEFLQRVNMSKYRVLMSSTYPPTPSTDFALVLRMDDHLNVIIFMFHDSGRVNEAFNSALTFRRTPFTAVISKVFVESRLFSFSSSAVSVMIKVKAIRNFLRLTAFFLHSELTIEVLISNVIRVGL